MAGDVAVASFDDLIRRGVLAIGDGYRAKLDELGGSGPMFLRAGLVSDTHITFEGAERFHQHLASKVESKMSKPGDVVITTKGNSTGRTAYVAEDMPSFVYSPHLSYWRSLKADSLVPGYLRYWSRGEEFQRQLRSLSTSTDMAPYLSLVDQRRLKITLPDPDYQRAIAHILGSLDDKIELNRQMNETLEVIARAIFKSWFVDFDPVRAKSSGEPSGSICRRLRLTPDLLALFPDRLVESELGVIPEGWEVKPLDEIASYLNGLALQKYPPESETEWLPVIKIAQLKSGSTAGADRASNRLNPEYVVDDGDVLFSWSGSLEVEVWCSGRGALNQHLFKVTSESFPKWFVFHWTREHLAHFRRIAAGKAVTMGHIQRRHLTEALCVVPSGTLLGAADDVVAPLFQALIESTRQARTLAVTRDALLPKVLSGELRVPLEGAV